MPDEFVTVAEVATLLRVTDQTVRNWIDRGELPAFRVGERRVRVRRADLDAFVNQGYTGSTAERGDGEQDDDRVELAYALDRARDALAVDDDGQLASALHALADAADRLAARLAHSTDGE